MHFLVFVPLTSDAHSLHAVSLGDIASGAMSTTVDVGPDGRPGTMFGWQQQFRPPVLTVNHDEQTWLPACRADGCDAMGRPLEAGRYFVGLWNKQPPTPGDLLRPRSFGGNTIALGDGLEWQVPNCSDLPHAWQVDDDGHWRLRAKREFRSLIVEAADMERRFRESSVDPVEGLEFAFRALLLNYRLTREVASHLELFTGGNEGTLRACFELCVGAEGEA